MSDEANITGKDNIVIQDIKDANINVFIGKSTDATQGISPYAPQPFISSLPDAKGLEGREEECELIIQAMQEAMSDEEGKLVLYFTAPGGFGKTALLTKLIKEKLTESHQIKEEKIRALLHLDCRSSLRLYDVFSKAGRLIGKEQMFQELYENRQKDLSEKLHDFFRLLSENEKRYVWFVLDNFETVFEPKEEMREKELEDFRKLLEACFDSEHRVRILIGSRIAPSVSNHHRRSVLELQRVGEMLFDGLPLGDCVKYLRGCGTMKDESEETLKEFSNKVHRIPMALVWADGYLNDIGIKLAELLQKDFFEDFDEYQYTNSPNYLEKGLKRLHYEQLLLQPPDALFILHLLAFVNHPVPRIVLEPFMPLAKLLKLLTRFVNNKLISQREAEDKRTQKIGDDSMKNLYSLHPIMCENILFNHFSDVIPLDASPLNETTVAICEHFANEACEHGNHHHAVRLFEIAELVCRYLISKHSCNDILDSFANILGNKGATLSRLNKYFDAQIAYDEAIKIYEQLKQNSSFGGNANRMTAWEIANRMAATLMNKGETLRVTGWAGESLEYHDSAIEIRRQIVKRGRADVEGDLAWTLINKGVALYDLSRFSEAVDIYDEAISLLSKLVKRGLRHYKDILALALLNKGVALEALGESDNALNAYNEAIIIFNYLEKIGKLIQRKFNGLALKNKANIFQKAGDYKEALKLYDDSITVFKLSVESGFVEDANDMAIAYMCKAYLLTKLEFYEESIECCNQTIKLLTEEVFAKQDIRVGASFLEANRLLITNYTKLTQWEKVGAGFAIFLFFTTNLRDAPDIAYELEKTYSLLRDLNIAEQEYLCSAIGDLSEIFQELIASKSFTDFWQQLIKEDDTV